MPWKRADRTQPIEAEAKTKDLKGKLAKLKKQMRYLSGNRAFGCAGAG